MPTIPSLSNDQLQAICDVIGETSTGLTGSEIGQMLAQCRIEDPVPGMTKRHRLFSALSDRQRIDRCANNVMAFVLQVMNPVRWVGRQTAFQDLRSHLNQVLAFVGFSIGEDGKALMVKSAETLTEAQQRAGNLRRDLLQRSVHPDVLRFCREELLQENYFHAVFEATKSVADKIRERAGLTSDGAELVDQAFGIGKVGIPMLAFNSLRTETERNEHSGLVNLIKGMFSAFRNVTAHAPRIRWPITEQDAKDLLSLASLLHRRIDEAARTHRPGPDISNPSKTS